MTVVDGPLTGAYDLVMLDLDGVVYVGSQAVPHAAESIARARADGARVAFITNNASRPPSAVAAHLTEIGVDADTSDVVTSAQAAARLLAERWGSGTRIVCLGAEGVRAALVAEGLVPVGVEDEAAAICSGYGPDLPWSAIMRAAVRIRDGLPWVASNTDTTIPTAFGTAPGHGVLVRMVQDFSGVTPQVAGKPERPLLDETVRRVGGRRPLMVGDRLDTDIEGARNAGVDSLLVLTGVTDAAALLAAPPRQRPTYLSSDLTGLLASHQPARRDGDVHLAGRWRARVVDGWLQLDTGEPERAVRADDCADADDALRAACAAGWAHLDATGVAAVLPDDAPLAR